MASAAADARRGVVDEFLDPDDDLFPLPPLPLLFLCIMNGAFGGKSGMCISIGNAANCGSTPDTGIMGIIPGTIAGEVIGYVGIMAGMEAIVGNCGTGGTAPVVGGHG